MISAFILEYDELLLSLASYLHVCPYTAASRSAKRLRETLAITGRTHRSLDTKGAAKLLADIDAENALEGGDQRLKAYFNASKVAWSAGAVTAEAGGSLRTSTRTDITE
jgi:hypothetical protein